MASSDPIDPAKAALERARAAARSGGPAPSTSNKRSTAPPPRGTGFGRDPVLVGEAVGDVLAERGWQPQAAVGALTGRWSEIVGPDVAAHVAVEGYDAEKTTLLLRTDSTAWATQVRLLLPTLMTRLSEELGPGTVTSVTVLGPSAPSWVKGLRTVPGRGPRDTYG